MLSALLFTIVKRDLVTERRGGGGADQSCGSAGGGVPPRTPAPVQRRRAHTATTRTLRPICREVREIIKKQSTLRYVASAVHLLYI